MRNVPTKTGVSIFHSNDRDGNFVISVRLENAMTSSVSVGVKTVSITAEEGIDFHGLDLRLEFPAGSIEREFVIKPIDRNVYTLGSKFGVRMIPPPSLSSVDDEIELTLRAEGRPPAFAIENQEVSESEVTASVEVRVVLDTQIALPSVFEIYTEDGTATEFVDFVPIRSILVIDPGDLIGAVSVPIVDDGIVEGAETFSVRIVDLQGNRGNQQKLQITIEDDDRNEAYSRWATNHALSGTASLSGADIDGDGSVNLVEFGSGSVPTDPFSQPVSPVVERNGAVSYLTPTLPYDTSGLQYQLEVSNDLRSWTVEGVELNEVGLFQFEPMSKNEKMPHFVRIRMTIANQN
jgi:hypothetical protein